jgi:glycerophosphoryl diester phosphodiesterase
MRLTPRFTPRSVAFLCISFFFLLATAHAGILKSNKVQLLCHRTANRDLPENTLESLAFAAHMGCDIVEVDVRRTLDGQLVLNHDGFLDRFTDTTGEVETTDLRELDRMDFGAWMGERFRGFHIAHFDDALRLARELNIGLYLDIKTKGIGPEVLEGLAREGMTKRVIFGGEWDDIRQLDPGANEDPTGGVQPGFTRDDVAKLHAQHKIVIASFILNGHEFDLDGMKQAVADGVDGIMVDSPRLGGEAVGRPVEEKIARLTREAETGVTAQRVHAIRELSYLVGLPLEPEFLHLLQDPDAAVSHEAGLALIMSRPQPGLADLKDAMHSAHDDARANAAWVMGSASAAPDAAPDQDQCAALLRPLLSDASTTVVTQALVALARCPLDPAHVPSDRLVQLLTGEVPVLRGLAAVVLAKNYPDIAAREIPKQLDREVTATDAYNVDWTARGRPMPTQEHIDWSIAHYRAQMKEVQALAMLPDAAAIPPLAEQAFRPGHDYSMAPIEAAGFRLWDHLAADPKPALDALRAQDTGEADWAEWTLVKAGPGVLPAVRAALPASQGDLRRRLIQILTWQADEQALPLLRSIEKTDEADRELIPWAISTIEAFHVP